MIYKQNLNEMKTASFPVIPTENFEKTMAEEVMPFLESKKKSKLFDRGQGFKLYCEYYEVEDAVGTILISHGFSECTKKFDEMAYYMIRRGYAVCMIDHRGHGNSRKDSETNVAKTPSHIDRFQDYVDDMHYVVKHVLRKELPKPYFLYCHSMGGAVGALYAQQHPHVFEKIVFSAPMFEINRGGIPYVPAKILVNVASAIGLKKKFMLTKTVFNPEDNFEESPDTNYERYLHYLLLQRKYPKMQSAGPSFNWVKESFKANETLVKPENVQKIECPVLLFQAEKDDFVLASGHDKFMEEIEHGRYVYVPGSKHEIFYSDNDILEKYLYVIFDFLSVI